MHVFSANPDADEKRQRLPNVRKSLTERLSEATACRLKQKKTQDDKEMTS